MISNYVLPNNIYCSKGENTIQPLVLLRTRYFSKIFLVLSWST